MQTMYCKLAQGDVSIMWDCEGCLLCEHGKEKANER